MKHHAITVILCLFALVATPMASGAPLEAYGRLPVLDDLAISPDGKQLAYVTSFQGSTAVVVYAIDSAKIVAGVNLKTLKVRDLRWPDNDNVLITTSSSAPMEYVQSPAQELSVAQIYNVSSKTIHPLLEGEQDSLNVLQGRLENRIVNGRTIIYVRGIHFVNGRGVLTLFTVELNPSDPALNRIKIVELGTQASAGWIVGDSGDVVASIEYHEGDHHWILNRRQDDHWIQAYDVVAPIDRPSVEGLGPDGHSLILHTYEGANYVTKKISLVDGSIAADTDSEASAGYPLVDPVSGQLAGHISIGAGFKYTFFSKADQAAWNSIVAAFAGQTVQLYSWSADRKRVIVLVDGPQVGSEYEMVDLNTGLAKLIGPAYQDIGAPDVAEVKFLTYTAADGRKIPAYLTLPSGRAHANLPLVVLAHGGPTAQDRPSFDWWAQALASRGYAVLQPQFRGSAGFGWEHLVAGFGQWGRKMQTDLSDGVRYLAGQGTIDPKRVCIVGASYGGYAALAGATLDRGVYRCAVADAGVSDPRGMLSWTRDRQTASDSIALRFLTRFMGVEKYDDPRLSEISPLDHAAAADVPILLIHGTSDTIVPISQSEAMESTLRAAGRPVSFVKLDSEDHWLSRSETREQMLQATVAFLEKYNPAQ